MKLRMAAAIIMITTVTILQARNPSAAWAGKAKEELVTTHPASDAKWSEFVRQYVVPLQRYGGNRIIPMEYRSQRLERVFPRYRVFLAKNAPTYNAGPYLVTNDGEIHDVKWEFSYRDGDKYLRNESLEMFLKEQHLGGLTDEKKVVDLLLLLEDLGSLAGMDLDARTDVLKIYQFKASRTGNTWTVRREGRPEYAGKPTSEMAWYPVVIDVDQNGFIVGFKRLASTR